MMLFTHKQPANYPHPYKAMLADIDAQVKEYTTLRGIRPNYIVIFTDDKEELLAEMVAAKLLTSNKPVGKLQYQGIRIITSTDIPAGYFEVLGS
jgi:uncharacterized protein (UPF0254 family)